MKSVVSGDLLSAASLLVTSIGILFGAWHKDIQTAIEKRDLTGPQKQSHVELLRGLRWYRTFPLVLFAVLLAAALTPSAIKVVCSICFAKPYDPVAACFILVYIFIILLAALNIADFKRIGNRLTQVQ